MKHCVVVTGGEASLGNAISSHGWRVVHCWNHIIREIERWTRDHSGCSDDRSIIKGNVAELLRCDTADSFNDNLNSLRASWSQPFCKYFDTFVMSVQVVFA